MKNWITKTLLTALAVFFLSWWLPGVSIEQSYFNAIMVAAVLGFLNSSLKPILVVLTLPATILTLGLFMWVINAFVILVADWALDGFTVDGFWWALIFSGLLSFVNSFLHKTFIGETENQSFNFNRRKSIKNDNVHTTDTGNKVYDENGKKTIIIEKD
ncbi:MAG: putative membrane protein [Planctomycetota bacterium]|jgi:putative membrane protein